MQTMGCGSSRAGSTQGACLAAGGEACSVARQREEDASCICCASMRSAVSGCLLHAASSPAQVIDTVAAGLSALACFTVQIRPQDAKRRGMQQPRGAFHESCTACLLGSACASACGDPAVCCAYKPLHQAAIVSGLSVYTPPWCAQVKQVQHNSTTCPLTSSAHPFAAPTGPPHAPPPAARMALTSLQTHSMQPPTSVHQQAVGHTTEVVYLAG